MMKLFVFLTLIVFIALHQSDLRCQPQEHDLEVLMHQPYEPPQQQIWNDYELTEEELAAISHFSPVDISQLSPEEQEQIREISERLRRGEPIVFVEELAEE